MPKASNGGEQGHNFPDLMLNGLDDTTTPAIVSFGLIGKDASGNYRRILVAPDGSLNTSPSPLALQLDDVSTTSVTYVGKAPIGTAVSAASWQVMKIDQSGSPIDLTIKWAGTGVFDQVFANRTTLTYV